MVAYVRDLLNGRDLSAVEQLFHQGFVDRDPLVLPGVLPADGMDGRRGVEAQVRLLSAPGVDMQFTLEDVFDNGDDRAAYRLFGQGSLPLTAEFESRVQGPSRSSPAVLRGLDVAGTRIAFDQDGLRRLQVLPERLMVTYSCVGVFRSERGRLIERWGSVHVA